MKTVEFLEAVKARYGLPSDYALAALLGCRQQTLSQYRTKPQYMDDSLAIKVAKLLDLDAGYVVACIHAERSKRDDVREMWQKTAKALKSSAAAVVLVLGILVGTPQTPSSVAFAASPTAANFQISLLC